MKPSHLFSTSIVTTGALAYSGSFFANVSGTFKPISRSVHSQYLTLNIWKPHMPLLPEFTLEGGIISNGDNEKNDVFGIADDYLVFGNLKNVKPIEVQLDDHFKIVNIQPYLCGLSHGKSSSFFSASDHSSRFLTCFQVDIYFMPSTEHVDSKIEDKVKRQLESAPAEVSENIQSLIASQGKALIDDHSDHTDSSNNELKPRALIAISNEAENRKVANRKAKAKLSSDLESKLERLAFFPFKVLKAAEFLFESEQNAQASKP